LPNWQAASLSLAGIPRKSGSARSCWAKSSALHHHHFAHHHFAFPGPTPSQVPFGKIMLGKIMERRIIIILPTIILPPTGRFAVFGSVVREQSVCSLAIIAA
jgi:hypothetical protein